MQKKIILLIIPFFIFGCNQNKKDSRKTINETSNNKSINSINSTSINDIYNNNEIYRFNKLAYLKKDSTLVTGEVKLFYKDNQIKKLSTYKEGKLEGPMKFWFQNGQLMQESTFKNGKPDGTRTMWYDDGQLKASGSYTNGKRVGNIKKYKDGKIIN